MGWKPLAAGHRTHDEKRLTTRGDRFGQRGIRRFVGQILLAGEEPQVRPAPLRDAMAVDSLDSCGVYFGTTGGQVYASADAGDHWAPIVRDLPAVLSVEVQTLP